jgi:hypothetical protein
MANPGLISSMSKNKKWVLKSKTRSKINKSNNFKSQSFNPSINPKRFITSWEFIG